MSLPVSGSDYCTSQLVAATNESATTLIFASPTEMWPLFDATHTYFYLTIVDQPSYIADSVPPAQREIFKVSSYVQVASGWALTGQRGSAGTTAQIWAVGSVAEVRPCAQWLEDLKGGLGGSIAVTDGETTVDPTTLINFITDNVTVTDGGGGEAQVSVSSSGGGGLATTAAVLEFNSGNTVIGYDITNPGFVFARSKDVAELGTGGVTYMPAATTRSAIYNYADDKMYFLAEKSSPAVTNVLVKFNPRTLVIDDEMELPTGWTSANSVLVDCTHTRAWITSSFDGTMRAFSLTTLLEVFNDSGALTTLSGAVEDSISGSADMLLTRDAGDLLLLHRITVTSPTTFTDESIVIPGDTGLGNIPFWGGNGSYRRQWGSNNDSILIGYDSGGVLGGITNILVSMQLAVGDAVSTQFAPVDKAYDLVGPGPFWDKLGQAFVMGLTGDDTGIAVPTEAGNWVGIAAINSTDWTAAYGTLGLLAWAQSLTSDAFAGFSEASPVATPAETYETNDGFITPEANTFVPGLECIAPVLQSSGGGGGGGGMVQATYVVMSASPDLNFERVLTAGANITITDNGPNSTVVIAASGGGGGGTLQSEEFTASGTWTVPAGVTGCWISGIGGGGGGGGSQASSTNGGGGGGAGEECSMLPLNVTPADVITVTIGAGGSGGAVGVIGGDGGTTSAGPFSMLGGLGGKDATTGAGVPGGGRGGGWGGGTTTTTVASVGIAESLNFFGGSSGGNGGGAAPAVGFDGAGSGGRVTGGAGGAIASSHAGGGGGGATVHGVGGAGGAGQANGVAAGSTSYGAGGGGAGASTAGSTGGAGKSGYVLILFIA